MKKNFCLKVVLILIGFNVCISVKSFSQEAAFIKENTDFACRQIENILKEVGDPNNKNYPRTLATDKSLKTTSKYDWTPGFFPGILWYLYELSGNEKWKVCAEK